MVLLIISGKLTAQKATIAPLDNPLSNNLIRPFKADSTWRVNLPVSSTNKLFTPQSFKSNLPNALAINTGSYNMPVIKTKGNSKMPVIKLQGNSKMPIAGNDNEVVAVNP
ncbi:hypothetical protein GCM10007352_29330 [Mucilaginibacter phyllosphaerae]|nr:hypothetical protein GCM10007352_29330 [Mucilaginibacter phyllosphaerae]